MGKRFTGSSFIIVLLCVCQQVSSFTPCQIGRKQAVLPTMTTTSTKSAVTTADDILAPASNLPETKQHTNGIEKFLIHRGRSLCMIKRSPSIGGLGLCKGWTPKATKNFVDAIEKMVKLNPILSGHVYENLQFFHGRNELRIQSGTFPVDSHEFVKIIEPKDILIDFENLSPTEMVKEVTEKCYPLLEESELTSAQIKKRLPLFGATLILLPNDYALYSIKVSHAVGDGVTFFMLLKQLSLLMSGLPAPAIDWDHPKKPLHELYPPELSAKDVELMYGAPFMVGAAKNILTQPARKVEVLLLDKEKVHKKKQELRKNLECPNLSSNDVITAALCQGGLSSDVIVFTEDARGEKSGIGHNAAGNFLVEIPIPREVGSQPDKLREIVAQLQSLQEMGLQELSLKPFIHGRVGRITSLATIPAGLVYKDTKQVCAIPYLSFLERIPLDTALIFRFNKQYWGVLHNFADFEAPELLKELVEETEESSDQSGKENRPEMIETPPQTDSIPFYAKLECTK